MHRWKLSFLKRDVLFNQNCLTLLHSYIPNCEFMTHMHIKKDTFYPSIFTVLYYQKNCYFYTYFVVLVHLCNLNQCFGCVLILSTTTKTQAWFFFTACILLAVKTVLCSSLTYRPNRSRWHGDSHNTSIKHHTLVHSYSPMLQTLFGDQSITGYIHTWSSSQLSTFFFF